MAIRKVTGIEGGFCIVPNDTLNDFLSWEAIGVLAYLCSKPHNWRVSISQLQKHSSRSIRPTGRDKTYKIIKELINAGYIAKKRKRLENGSFGPVEYVVSPSKFTEDVLSDLFGDPLTDKTDVAAKDPLTDKTDVDENPSQNPLTENPEVVSDGPLTDKTDVEREQPLPALPDTAETTLQRKRIKKDYIIAGEKKELEKISSNQTELFANTVKPIKKEKQKPLWPEDFLEFWENYPKNQGSQKTALNAWKRLNKAKKALVLASLPQYRAYIDRAGARYTYHAHNYIKNENYESYQPLQEASKPTKLVNGNWYRIDTMTEICAEYFAGTPWKFDKMLGPPPDHQETQIPQEIITAAKHLANEK